MDYTVYSVPPTIAHVVYPNGVTLTVGRLDINLKNRSFTALWRVYDPNGAYPTSGYGEASL